MTISSDHRTSDGFILVLASGLLVLLAAAALSFTGLARATGGMRSALRAELAGRLAAETGLEYAAARLWETADRFPGKPRIGEAGWDPACRSARVWNRGDDWHYRAYDADDGSWDSQALGPIPLEWLDPPLSGTLHPSWARGESWTDSDGNALFDPGETWTDADGNGRRDVWSGRLRRTATGDGRFVLRVEPGAGSKIGLNAAPGADAARLRAFLNQLGAILGVRTFVANTPAPAVPVLWSDLGNRVVAALPSAGFRSLEDLRGTLTDAEIRAIRRFVTVSPRLFSRHVALMEAPQAKNPVVMDLNGAPLRTIEACLRYRKSRVPTLGNVPAWGGIGLAGIPDRNGNGSFPAAEQATIGGTNPFTGRPYSASLNAVVIAPPEARRAARALSETGRGAGGFQSHQHLYRTLIDNKEAFFPLSDHPITDTLDPAHNPPYFAEGYQNMRIDMVFSILGGGGREFAATGYDADRYTRWETDGSYYPGPGRQLERPGADAVGIIPAPPFSTDPFSGAAWSGDAPAATWIPGEPTVFDIRAEARGPAGSAEGTFLAGERLQIVTLEDFANYTVLPPPWGRGQAARVTPRGFRVEGTPVYPDYLSDTGNPLSTNRSVIIGGSFPHDVYTPLDLGHIDTPPSGGLTLARRVHGPQDRNLPGEYLRVRYPLGTGPDPRGLDHLLAGLDTGGAVFSPFAPWLNEAGGWHTPTEEEACEILAGSSAESVVSAKKWTYLFAQCPGTGEQATYAFPRLPLPSRPVPPEFLGIPGQNPYQGGEYHAVSRIGFSFTSRKGPAKPNSNPNNPNGPGGEIFSLVSAPMGTNPALGSGCLFDLKIHRWTGNKWGISTLNGPFFDGNGVSWTGSGGYAAHRRVFEGTLLGGSASTLPLPARQGDENEPHQVTFAYWTRDSDGTYPPEAGRLLLWVDGEKVIDRSLAWSGPDLPATDPPRAEMFFPAVPDPMDPFGFDSRRVIALACMGAEDVAFFDPPLDENLATHQDYRLDTCCRIGRFDSARYVFPQAARVRRIDWSGVVPEGSGSMSLEVRCQSAGAAPLHAVLLDPVTATSGGEPYDLLAGRDLPPGAPRSASLDFSVTFDCSGAAAPFRHPPALEEIWIRYQSRPRWLSGHGHPLDTGPGDRNGDSGGGGGIPPGDIEQDDNHGIDPGGGAHGGAHGH